MNAWQLVSANISHQRSLDIFIIREKPWDLLTSARTLLPCSPFKRPSPGMCPIWNCLEMCVTQANLGSQLCYWRSWKFEERCTAILFGTTLVMAVCAPDTSKSLEMYEACISSVIEVLREGRRGGAKDFYITSGIGNDVVTPIG